MKIELRNSDEFFEVDEDFVNSPLYSGTFGLSQRGYVRTNMALFKGENLVHRHIIGAKKGDVVDHIDGNKLNNKKSNLRICTQVQNTWNQKARNPKSGYKGVYKTGKGWQARIRMFGKLVNIGFYSDKEEAAREYNKAAKEKRGEFAVLNEISEASK